MEMDRMPVKTALLFSGHTSLIRVNDITSKPPVPKPLRMRHSTMPHQLFTSPVQIVNMEKQAMVSNSDIFLPIRSPTNPQRKPPAAHPKMNTELTYALISFN